MDEENLQTAPSSSILPKHADIAQPGGDDPAGGIVSVEQINIETPSIDQRKYLFRMIPHSKTLTRLDVSSMKEQEFTVPVNANYAGDSQPGVFIPLSDAQVFMCGI